MSVPLELVAVKMPPGPVTERQWWEALADRVQELADKAGEQGTSQACKALNVPEPEYSNQAGQSLVLHNLKPSDAPESGDLRRAAMASNCDRK